MAGSEQAEINVTVTTPLEDGKFYLRRLRGIEAVSRLFEFKLELLSADLDVKFTDLLGQPVSLEMAPAST